MISLIEKLGWRTVSVLNVGGDKYGDYMSTMQDRLVFKSNTKFPSNTNDFQSVGKQVGFNVDVCLSTGCPKKKLSVRIFSWNMIVFKH